MSLGLEILSFNWHEPYLWLLAKTGHRFEVAEPYAGRGAVRRWDRRVRPIPQNMSVISEHLALQKLKDKKYDLAVCHNFRDLRLVADNGVPAVLIFHNKLTTELALGGDTVDRGKYLQNVTPLAGRAEALVFVSESKREDWGLGGGITIKPGVDIDDLITYEGNKRKILRVGNRMKERGLMLGYSLQEDVCSGFDHTLAGDNPGIERSGVAGSWDELALLYSSHRVYLNTTLAPYEDGYNLSSLEAMAAGAPVISYANPTSPVENGVNGYISGDTDELKARVSMLMKDHDLAKKLGGRARESVRELFGIEQFKSRWNSVFENTSARKGRTPDTGAMMEGGAP